MDIQEVRNQLPLGAVKEIVTRSGVQYATVQRFFRGEETKQNLNLLRVTAQYLKEYKEAKATAIKELQAVASA
jgi:hypothetical protein